MLYFHNFLEFLELKTRNLRECSGQNSYPRSLYRTISIYENIPFHYASWRWGHGLITEHQASPEHSGRKLQSFLIESCNGQLLPDANIASVINGSPHVCLFPHVYIAHKVTQKARYTDLFLKNLGHWTPHLLSFGPINATSRMSCYGNIVVEMSCHAVNRILF